MKSFLRALRGLLSRVTNYVQPWWRKYRTLRPRTQIIIAVVAFIAVIALFAIVRAEKPNTSAESLRAVSLASVGELGGDVQSGTMFGVVRSVSEAMIVAESSGTVTSVHTSLGAYLPAGAIIAEIENASERASVLQAEGVYDAAIAARDAVSLSQTEVSAEAQYRSAFATLDDILTTDIDSFFGGPSSSPNLTIDGGGFENQLTKDRAALSARMTTWRYALEDASSKDPQTILAEAAATTSAVNTFLNDLALVANRGGSQASATQLASLASARTTVSTLTSTLSTAQSTYRSGSVGATASADASVKQALGALRASQAGLEKTRFRALIAGTVNYLPLRVGDPVTQGMHVATIAQNQSLEAVAYVSEDTRSIVTTGDSVSIDGIYDGIITAIAPALDPVTKQVEVRVAITNAGDELTNGSSVQIALTKEVASAKPTGPQTLPLSAVKLRADDRVVFGVNEEGRLVAYAVTTGTVRGDRIEILNDLPLTLTIVTDARGLAGGQAVTVVGR